ncbi:metal ABC transporter ATP-binding protein [Hyphomicrobium sp.]|uniref:metal ABC transporter ATP-binding protein n=1 Tax=Hyphomicrobium sp. TaxID=82 RepID=UPI002CF47912|nr:metal ABC transporter ATP-binding protein [Hyphomicrobium sp.]HRN85542.1 metal ABC transporter ATP-binding protein [Hyphomicrobium sp.]HRQ27684.1 metal ABC transporter ATP-binding protein [Hyphomicrobium sp.]
MNERPGDSAEASCASAHGAHNHSHGHHHTHDGTCCGGHGATHRRPPGADILISARALAVARSGRTILSDVDLDIAAGEIVTIIGPNGAGKTTLVRALLGLERLDEGEVQRRRGLTIGYVPQRFDIDRTLPMTVARFLALGEGARASRIAAVLEEVGASRVANQQLGELSGGELQRVLLARALLNDPDLLVLDEPVRGVDYVGEAELYTLIGKLRDARGLGVLLISHDLHIVMGKSDRVICLNRHVCCSGVPETVAQHPEYVRLFGRDEARAFAVYQHRHDHRHDLAGEPAPVGTEDSNNGPSGGSA